MRWQIWVTKVSDQTVGNILKRNDIPPAPQRKQNRSWRDFIRTHMAVMVGTDFFTAEVLTLRGLKTYYVLFFLHLESRRIYMAGVTRHPDEEWMEQMARNVTMESTGFLTNCCYPLVPIENSIRAERRPKLEHKFNPSLSDSRATLHCVQKRVVNVQRVEAADRLTSIKARFGQC